MDSKQNNQDLVDIAICGQTVHFYADVVNAGNPPKPTKRINIQIEGVDADNAARIISLYLDEAFAVQFVLEMGRVLGAAGIDLTNGEL